MSHLTIPILAILNVTTYSYINDRRPMFGNNSYIALSSPVHTGVEVKVDKNSTSTPVWTRLYAAAFCVSSKWLTCVGVVVQRRVFRP